MDKLEYELNLLRKLISFDTDSIKKSYYKECAKIIKEECEKIGLKVEIYDGEEEAKDGISRPSVVANIDKGSDKNILLLTHYDIVPAGKGWTKDPFDLTIENGKAYGRGCADDKGCIAVVLGALCEVYDKLKYNVIFAAVPEEEIGGRYGAGYIAKKIPRIDEVLVLDAGNEYISIGASGVVFGEIKVYGDQGHAGYPFRYRNAAQDLIRLLYHLSEYSIIRSRKISKFDAPPESPIPKNFGRFSITMLGAGEKENVIPGLAYARFDMRLIPEENYEEAINEFKSFFVMLANSLGIKAEISWIEGGGNYISDPNSDAVVKFKKIASEEYNKDLKIVTELGGNDGRYFANRNIPIISFGLAAKDTRYHGPDEFVYLDDMVKLKSILKKIFNNMKCKVGVVLGENLKYAFPEPHPLNYRRYEYFINLLHESNFYKEGRIIKLDPRKASDEEILLFHTPEYLEFVKRISEIGYGYLDYGDTPAFKGVYEVSALSVGATLRALEAIINGEVDHAFNPSGGLHHAYKYKAAGFCVFNDPAIAIEYSRKKYGFKKFLYVDIDAHHGDGVYYSYEDDPNVYIIDLHEDGRFLYPGTGFENERGKGEAYGTKLNIPLKPFSDSSVALQYLPKIKEFIENIDFDLIILQCGADGLEGDPLTHLRYSPKVHEEITKLLHKFAHEKCKGRILATGGGGYNFNNVAKAWVTVVETLAKEY